MSLEEGLKIGRPQVRRMLANFSGSLWIVTDFILAVVSIAFGYWVTPFANLDFSAEKHLPESWHIWIYGGVLIVMAHVFGLHDPRLKRDARELLAKLMFTVLLASAITVTVSLVLFYASVGRYILISSAIMSGLLMFVSRWVYWRLIKEHRLRISVVGERRFCETAIAFLSGRSENMDVTYICLKHKTPDEAGAEAAPLWIEDEEREHPFDLQAWAERQGIDEVVADGKAAESLHHSLLGCLDSGIAVLSYAEFVERHFHCVPVSEIDARWFLGAAKSLSPYYRVLKRLMDVAVGVAGLVLSLPIMILAGIAIRLESPGPIFYSQTRVGARNRPFRIYKLRSMRQDAEKSGAQWASKSDSRVTRVGRFLRKTRIDELPQFWNILKGDMSFIGPRPERPEFTGKLAEDIPFYQKRHMVKPGLTGWAQISYEYADSMEGSLNKLKYDLYYVKHASLELDLHILIRTIGAAMKGAR